MAIKIQTAPTARARRETLRGPQGGRRVFDAVLLIRTHCEQVVDLRPMCRGSEHTMSPTPLPPCQQPKFWHDDIHERAHLRLARFGYWLRNRGLLDKGDELFFVEHPWEWEREWRQYEAEKTESSSI